MAAPVAVTVDVHQLDPAPEVTPYRPAGRGFVTVQLSAAPAAVNLFLHTPAECDALTRAAVAAKTLLTSGGSWS